jgi:hypothetical protein
MCSRYASHLQCMLTWLSKQPWTAAALTSCEGTDQLPGRFADIVLAKSGGVPACMWQFNRG